MRCVIVKTFAALAISSCFAVGSAQATQLPDCDTSSVTVTSVYNVTGGATREGLSQSASACVGAYDKNAAPVPTDNLGYYQDGLLNGAPQVATHDTLFPDGIFSDQYTAADLGGSSHVDPGWILLASWDPKTGELTLPLIGTASGIQKKSWFSFTGTGSRGTWSFIPDKDVADRVKPVLGDNLFDQFALVFKSGSAFAAYDFVGSDFDLPTSSDTIYGFSGDWDMSSTLINGGGKDAGLSHIDFYVRDPNDGGSVPEPATLALLGVGIIGLGFGRRRKS